MAGLTSALYIAKKSVDVSTYKGKDTEIRGRGYLLIAVSYVVDVVDLEAFRF